ncbi:hypothetical protein RCH23_002886 [Cryobacterium sp. CAN_C3]|nr:hypothetical protein [Cryobacterium sp. CAN_C3]
MLTPTSALSRVSVIPRWSALRQCATGRISLRLLVHSATITITITIAIPITALVAPCNMMLVAAQIMARILVTRTRVARWHH